MKTSELGVAVGFLFAFLQCAAQGVAAPSTDSTSLLQTGQVEAGTAAESVTAPAEQVQTYDELVKAIRSAKAESRERVERAVEQERVREAWEIGKLIDEHVLQHKERAEYGKEVLKRLSSDLGMSGTELYYMLEFARAYPNFRAPGKLSWSQYEVLLSVNDPAERAALEDRAADEKWTYDQTRAEVKKYKASFGKEETTMPGDEETLTPLEVGQAGTYKVILAETGPYAGELALDLGFSNYYRLSNLIGSDISDFKEGDIASFEGDAYRVLKMASAAQDLSRLYTYKAWVNRVLDGDTIEAVVSFGFGLATTQVLRLRGIDAPEINTKSGREAKEFVEKLLLPGTQIFIKTAKSDKYDRYLVDVFVTDPKSGEDQYLNGLLLEKGYAVKVSES